MSLAVLLVAAPIGYPCGAVSVARLTVRRLAPDRELSAIEVPMPGITARFTFRSISTTTVWIQYGPKYGCLTSVLDMLKVAVPTSLFRLAYPEAPDYWPLRNAFTDEIAITEKSETVAPLPDGK